MGIASGKKRSGSKSSRALLAEAIAASSVPTAATPRSASSTPAIAAPLSPEKKSWKAGSATVSATSRNASMATALASQIALRSHGASTSPSKSRCSRSATNARVRPRMAVNRIAIQSRPRAERRELSAGKAKWKTTRAARTKRSIVGRVSRARNSSSRSFRARTRTSRKYSVMRVRGLGRRAERDAPARASRRASSRGPGGRRARARAGRLRPRRAR